MVAARHSSINYDFIKLFNSLLIAFKYHKDFRGYYLHAISYGVVGTCGAGFAITAWLVPISSFARAAAWRLTSSMRTPQIAPKPRTLACRRRRRSRGPGGWWCSERRRVRGRSCTFPEPPRSLSPSSRARRCRMSGLWSLLQK